MKKPKRNLLYTKVVFCDIFLIILYFYLQILRNGNKFSRSLENFSTNLRFTLPSTRFLWIFFSIRSTKRTFPFPSDHQIGGHYVLLFSRSLHFLLITLDCIIVYIVHSLHHLVSWLDRYESSHSFARFFTKLETTIFNASNWSIIFLQVLFASLFEKINNSFFILRGWSFYF